jgi:hypothetical protein
MITENYYQITGHQSRRIHSIEPDCRMQHNALNESSADSGYGAVVRLFKSMPRPICCFVS